MTNRSIIFLCFISMLSLLSACAAVETDNELKDFRKELDKDNRQMEQADEADIDDDLNPIERKDVDKIFKEDLKEQERMEKTIFSD